MPIEFRCPQCSKLLRTAEDKAGRTANCPGCGAPVTVPAAEESAEPYDEWAEFGDREFGDEGFDEFGAGEDLGAAGTAARGADTKTCPMCGEEVPVLDTRCRFCGEALEGRRPRRPTGGRAREKVSGPAVGLIVTGVIGVMLQLAAAAVNFLAVVGEGQQQRPGFGQPGPGEVMFSGTVGLVAALIGVAVGVVIIVGAVKMKELESYAFAMTSTILAMVPCTSPCCLIGLPIGIWSLVVLNDTDVRSAFR